MSSLMRSVLDEVENQRRDMLRIIEDVASIEILSKDTNEWGKKKDSRK